MVKIQRTVFEVELVMGLIIPDVAIHVPNFHFELVARGWKTFNGL
jgi:hypothetical protein